MKRALFFLGVFIVASVIVVHLAWFFYLALFLLLLFAVGSWVVRRS